MGMAKGEFLLEVRCEEIPARMLVPGIRQLATRVFEELTARNLMPKEVETGFTPRRLTLILKGLPQGEADRTEEMVGPPVRVAFDEAGEPTRAAIGFAERCGVEPAELRRVETDKGEYVAAEKTTIGRPTPQVLAELVPQVLKELSWAKTMRWGTSEGPWVRPVHGLLALYEGEVVPFELFGLRSGATTVGHSVHAPRSFAVRGAADYRRKLLRRGVEVRFEERKKLLWDRLRELGGELDGEPVEDPWLLDKLAAICGVPGVTGGRFDRGFLQLPREVLITSLRDHQSAFSMESEGRLVPGFLTVMDREDDPAGRIRAGNEWVVEARLADARFFYDEDRKRKLADRIGDLEHLTFQADLGSYADKADRIGRLTEVLCEVLGEAGGTPVELEPAKEASRLLKVDLTTEMVKEFTSLQGIMGGVYARDEGYPDEVWQAVYDQYLPAATDDEIPRGGVGRLTAVADRMDTLVGIFGLGLIPTGSRDPFGLRRAAQGVVRIVLEGELPLDLDLVAARSVLLYGDRLERGGEEILADLRPFLQDRVRHVLGLEGFAYDSIEAALAVSASDLPDLRARVEAVHRVREEPAFLSVVLAAKRIANIVKDADEHELDEALLKEEAEKELYRSANDLRSRIESAEAAGDYEGCLRAIGEFAESLDRFFVEVLVMDENREIRFNRVALLQSIQRLISRTARLTEVVVDRAEHRQKTGRR